MLHQNPIRQICIVEQAYYRWREQYAGIGVDKLGWLRRHKNGTCFLEELYIAWLCTT